MNKYISVTLISYALLASLCNASEDICLMLYQMADNNLEKFLRYDNYELTQSSAIKESRVTTWIYFDGRDDSEYTDPLPTVYESDGSRPSTKFSGSQYLTYSHELSKMIINQQLQGEQNSDDPNTVYDFVTHALHDCVARGSTEYVIIFSSHGTGFAGYGGDDNDNRRRHLLQSNENIVNALQVSLSNVEGAPTQLDVIGFDACLMSSYVATEEYVPVTKYFLASEATEPGHGWAYNYLAGDTALDMAKNIHDNFLSRKQGYSNHQSPKTMALVDTSEFETFHTALEALAEELERLLKATKDNKDGSFYSNLQRARSSAAAFDSYLDNSGGANPSAVDIGSFLYNLQSLCQPVSSSRLNPLLKEAIGTYNDMFVRRGVGPGTPAATGMHVMWPHRNVYKRDWRTFDDYLLDNPNVLDNAPAWFSFIKTYLNTNYRSSIMEADPSLQTCSSFVSAAGETGSVVVAENEFTTMVVESSDGSELLIDPAVVDNGIEVQVITEIAADVDQVVVEVGIDSTALVAHRRRKLGEGGDIVFKPPSEEVSLLHGSLLHGSYPRRRHRHLQKGNGDYFLLFLGTVAGTYNQTTFEASWDRKFFFLGDTPGDAMPVYVYDEGNGARSVPVIYFPPTQRITRDDIPIGTTLDEAVMKLGGRFGSLNFGYDPQTSQVTTDFTLFTNDQSSSNSTITETPPTSKGQIVPILYVDGHVDGYYYDMFLGGFDRTILRWSEEHSIFVQMVSATNYLNAIPYVNTLLVNVVAMDFDAGENGEESKSDSVHSSTFRIHQSAASRAGVSVAAITCLFSSLLFSLL